MVVVCSGNDVHTLARVTLSVGDVNCAFIRKWWTSAERMYHNLKTFTLSMGLSKVVS